MFSVKCQLLVSVSPLFSLQPSHADKAANPKVLKWMTDLTKIRRQIKGTTTFCCRHAFMCAWRGWSVCMPSCSVLDILTPLSTFDLLWQHGMYAGLTDIRRHARAQGQRGSHMRGSHPTVCWCVLVNPHSLPAGWVQSGEAAENTQRKYLKIFGQKSQTVVAEAFGLAASQHVQNQILKYKMYRNSFLPADVSPPVVSPHWTNPAGRPSTSFLWGASSPLWSNAAAKTFVTVSNQNWNQ